MTRKYIGAAALLALASMPAAAAEDSDVFLQVRPSLVQLVGAGGDGRYSLGSGVALPDGSIVTSCHVTLRAKRVDPSGAAHRRGLKRNVPTCSTICVPSHPWDQPAPGGDRQIARPPGRRQGLRGRLSIVGAA